MTYKRFDFDVEWSNQISKTRFAQIRNIMKETSYEDLDTISSNIDDTKKSIILAVQKQSTSYNKILTSNLQKFIDQFISSLTTDDLMNLVQLIDYYEETFDKLSGDLEEDYTSVDELETLPLNQRIERLLMQWTLLPKVQKVWDFNKEMYGLMFRLAKNIERLAKKSGLHIVPVEPTILLDAIMDTNAVWFELIGGEEIDSYLKAITFTASFPELKRIREWYFADDEINNHIKFELKFVGNDTHGVVREDIIEFLEDKWFPRDGDSFIIYGNDHIKIKAFLYNRIIQAGENGIANEKVTLELYAQAQRASMTSLQFIDLSLKRLCLTTEDIVNEIFEEYGAPKTPKTFNLYSVIDESYGEDDDDDGWSFEVVWVEDNPVYGGKNKKEEKKQEVENQKPKVKKHDDIILENNEQKEMEILIDQFENEEQFKEFWVDVPKWIVLHWPAGTWKTLFAKHISDKINAKFLVIKHTDIESKWVWESEKNMQKKFDQAKFFAKTGKKVILFFDEADSLFEQRSEKKNYKEWLISILLQEMDGINENSLENIFVFFTTNRVDSIDSAVLSRFDKKLKIGLPKFEQRITHFKMHINNRTEKSNKALFWEIDYDLLAKKTDGKSWRFIKQLINNVILNFAHSKIKNDKHPLITTEDIINGITLIEKEEKQKNSIGFHAKLK